VQDSPFYVGPECGVGLCQGCMMNLSPPPGAVMYVQGPGASFGSSFFGNQGRASFESHRSDLTSDHCSSDGTLANRTSEDKEDIGVSTRSPRAYMNPDEAPPVLRDTYIGASTNGRAQSAGGHSRGLSTSSTEQGVLREDSFALPSAHQLFEPLARAGGSGTLMSSHGQWSEPGGTPGSAPEARNITSPFHM
jgi:hypothetical protein